MELPRSIATAGATAVLAGALAACADMQWHKPGVPPDAMAVEMNQCRQHAYFISMRHYWALSPWPAFGGRDRFGRLIYARPYWDQTDRFFLEQDLFFSCMRGLGYELVPVEPPPKAPPVPAGDPAAIEGMMRGHSTKSGRRSAWTYPA